MEGFLKLFSWRFVGGCIMVCGCSYDLVFDENHITVIVMLAGLCFVMDALEI